MYNGPRNVKSVYNESIKKLVIEHGEEMPYSQIVNLAWLKAFREVKPQTMMHFKCHDCNIESVQDAGTTYAMYLAHKDHYWTSGKYDEEKESLRAIKLSLDDLNKRLTYLENIMSSNMSKNFTLPNKP